MMSAPTTSDMEKTAAPLDSREVFRLGTDFSPRSGHWGSALPFIYGLAAGCRARRMLEIGVWHGGSTRALLNAAALNDGHLTSIDVDDCAAAAPEALHRRWTFLRGDSRVVLPTLRDEIDFALVDGEHTFDAVSRELAEIDRLMAPRGCVLLDDCWAVFQGVVDAFHAFQSRRAIEKTLVAYGTEQSECGLDRTLGLIRFL